MTTAIVANEQPLLLSHSNTSDEQRANTILHKP